MKLQSINSITFNRNNNTRTTAVQGVRQSTPSFRGLPNISPMAALVGLATFIETKGFMGEFLTNDLFGMMGPRIEQGYTRNREELGHLNYKAGREEAVREFLSGPAYFYVPMLAGGATALFVGKAANVSKAAIDAFKPVMKNVASSYKDKDIANKFIDRLTQKAFKGFTHETDKIETIKQAMKDYADKKISHDKASKIAGEALTELNKANGQFLDDTRKVKLSGKEFKMENLLKDVKNYTKSFAKKASKTDKNAVDFIKVFHRKAKNLRNVANILSIAALSAFLVIIPKLYKTGGKFPGKDGLVKDQKPADSSAKGSEKKEGAKIENK